METGVCVATTMAELLSTVDGAVPAAVAEVVVAEEDPLELCNRFPSDPIFGKRTAGCANGKKDNHDNADDEDNLLFVYGFFWPGRC